MCTYHIIYCLLTYKHLIVWGGGEYSSTCKMFLNTIITSTNFSKSNTSLSVYFVCFPSSPLRFSFTDGFGGTKVILPLTQITYYIQHMSQPLFLFHIMIYFYGVSPQSGHLHNFSKPFFKSSNIYNDITIIYITRACAVI